MLLNITQIIVSILLVSFILLQAQGTGLGRVFGGSGASYHTKRGVERVLFGGTIVLVVVFMGLSVLNVVT